MHSSSKNERRSGGGPDRFKDRSGSRAKSDFANREQSQESRENGSDSKSGEKINIKSEQGHSRDSMPRGKMERLRKERDETQQQAMDEAGEKKFTGRCRLFVGNIPGEWGEDDFKTMFEKFGEISEAYVNAPRGFGFIRMDTRVNAEAAKRALDGTMHKNRMLRVRFAAHTAALKVKYLPPHVTNELLEKAFSQFGEVERAIVIGDDRGKSVGEGFVEFARKTGAQQALNRINNGVFLMGVAPRPIVVESLEQRDEEDGVSEKFLQKMPNSYRERERDPGFAEPGSFEFEYGQKWKDLYNLERQRQEQLKREMEDAFVKLESDMEGAEQEYQAILLRQDLMRRQEELKRLEEDMARRRGFGGRGMGLEHAGRREEMRHPLQRDMEDDRRRQEMIMRQQQEEMRRREMEHRGMRSREEERELLMQASHLREQGMGQHAQQQQQMRMQNQGQPQMQRQSRFDQPPQAQSAMFNQMANQNAAMQNMQQRGQSQQQQQQQGQHGGQGGGQQMERNSEQQGEQEFYEGPKRARRY